MSPPYRPRRSTSATTPIPVETNAETVAFDPQGYYQPGEPEPFDAAYDEADLLFKATAGGDADLLAWGPQETIAIDLSSADRVVAS